MKLNVELLQEEEEEEEEEEDDEDGDIGKYDLWGDADDTGWVCDWLVFNR